MVELFSSNDLVLISWTQAMLRAAGITCVLLDEHVSAIEGSIGAIPRRLLVDAEDVEAARRVLDEARGPAFDSVRDPNRNAVRGPVCGPVPSTEPQG